MQDDQEKCLPPAPTTTSPSRSTSRSCCRCARLDAEVSRAVNATRLRHRAAAAARGDLPAATTTTSAATRGVAQAPAARARWRSSAAQTLSQLQDRVLHEPARLPGAARLPDRAGQRDVPRPAVLPRAARAGGAAAAHLSVAQGLGGRLQHRRGGRTRWRSCCARRACSTRTLIYATDINPRRAAEGRGRRLRHRPHRRLHREPPRVGRRGRRCPTTTRRPTAARSSTSRCKQHIVFSDHSLATDSVFAEVQLVSCRNVLIYFDRELQDRALGLFREALCRSGFLGLGAKESLRFSAHADAFDELVARRAHLPEARTTRDDAGRPHAPRRRRRHRRLGRRRRGAVGDPAGAAGRTAARRSSSCCTCRASGRACWSRSSQPKCARAGARGRRTRSRSSPARSTSRRPTTTCWSTTGPQLALSVDDLVHFSRPSIDVLFESAADVYGDRLLGIILTGANEDGAVGPGGGARRRRHGRSSRIRRRRRRR